MPTDPGARPEAPARRGTAERWAIAGITIEFMALVRTLAEVFRLHAVRGAGFAFGADVRPYVVGALIAALFCWTSVTLFFLRRYRLAAILAGAMVVVLLVYRFGFMR